MANLYEQIVSKEKLISVIGLGYVGMPIAVAFAKKARVIGFDLNKEKVELYKKGVDPTKEVGNEIIKDTTIEFTSEESDLKKAQFHIVAVPTPVKEDHTPDLAPLESATRLVGRNLTKGSIIVFESTVYPGVTEDICIPILEKESSLRFGEDFKVGYSPERINPGDGVHRLENITKVVSGSDAGSLEIISNVYQLVVEAGIHKASTIKVAEAAKVIENSQRDINIAFMNELSIIFHKMDIDTKEVLEAAATKWNFLNFHPGLVGGHCIGVDPYYLTHKAEQLGYHSQIILSGRQINDEMGKVVADNAVKLMVKNKTNVYDAKVGIFGFTFKANCPDTRNTKVIDIIKELGEYNLKTLVFDPEAEAEETKRIYDISLADEEQMKELDLII
ncbi:MAG: nucleotide sugar dehydrogenase, partial [Atopostipes suicloacalis]|nr:nucleotide sugar dehydrogenase [Atopostipes suicloacalis]